MADAAQPRSLTCLGRCRCAFWLAIFFDSLGMTTLLPGIFLEEDDYSDLLIYLAGVNFFFSLPWWVFWYVGNLEVPPEELQDDVGLDDRQSLLGRRTRRLLYLFRGLGRSLTAAFGCLSRPSASFPPPPAPVHHPHSTRSESWAGQESPSTA